MKPLFTIHAGEYLVGSYIEEHYRNWRVWVPSKDTGIDLLVTDAKGKGVVSLQVKYSKDFNPSHDAALRNQLMAAGWWTHKAEKIERSQADLWVFALPSFNDSETSFIIISPGDLLRRLLKIRRNVGKPIQSYFWVTKSKRCWETRSLSLADKKLLAVDRFSSNDRDFTRYLNAWSEVERRVSE